MIRELAEAERRYESDTAFRRLVDTVAQHARSEQYTTNDIMTAALAACRILEREIESSG